MKSAVFLLIATVLVHSAPAQTVTDFKLQKAEKLAASSEVDEALHDFDFSRLRINPNNLRPGDIENLEVNFLPSVKPYLVKESEAVERLARLAEPIFNMHNSGKSRIVVFESRLPTVFTWKETFVVFSTGAMDVLSDKEITALVAHEIGHLYFAEEFARAAGENDDRRLRIIELKCDLVALETLTRLKIKPAKLISAVKELVKERGKLKVESFQPGSPSLFDREALSKIYLESN